MLAGRSAAEHAAQRRWVWRPGPGRQEPSPGCHSPRTPEPTTVPASAGRRDAICINACDVDVQQQLCPDLVRGLHGRRYRSIDVADIASNSTRTANAVPADRWSAWAVCKVFRYGAEHLPGLRRTEGNHLATGTTVSRRIHRCRRGHPAHQGQPPVAQWQVNAVCESTRPTASMPGTIGRRPPSARPRRTCNSERLSPNAFTAMRNQLGSGSGMGRSRRCRLSTGPGSEHHRAHRHHPSIPRTMRSSTVPGRLPTTTAGGPASLLSRRCGRTPAPDRSRPCRRRRRCPHRRRPRS